MGQNGPTPPWGKPGLSPSLFGGGLPIGGYLQPPPQYGGATPTVSTPFTPPIVDGEDPAKRIALDQRVPPPYMGVPGQGQGLPNYGGGLMPPGLARLQQLQRFSPKPVQRGNAGNDLAKAR
jgi:hypothetical protein